MVIREYIWYHIWRAHVAAGVIDNLNSMAYDKRAMRSRPIAVDGDSGDRKREHARALRGHGIEVVVHWIPGHSGIPGNEEADRQANKAREGRGYTVRERIYTAAAKRARWTSEGRTAAKAEWEADKCSKHYGYRLKGKAGSKRPVPITSVKSLAARFYRQKSGHAPTGPYLK
jgi:hypothetical protein